MDETRPTPALGGSPSPPRGPTWGPEPGGGGSGSAPGAPMPAVFVGHGNPMNALESNVYTDGWRAIARALPPPKAILCVSAHWYVRGTHVTAMERPRTIHDFGGFPQALYEVDYPAPGDPRLAERIVGLLAPTPVELDRSWGLDHGTWSVLARMFPDADVPVVQLSLDRTQPASVHYDIGRRLGALRDEGVLVLGSGNLVHNLSAFSWGDPPGKPHAWAVEFEHRVRHGLDTGSHEALIAYETLGEAAAWSVPTPDHYLPFLSTIALARPGEPYSYPVEGFYGSSISMLAVRVG